MNAGRIILLAIALVAGGAVFFLMSSGTDDVPTAQVIPQAPKVETAKVLVADRDFSRGERLSADHVRWVDWPANTLPEGAVTKDNEEFFSTLPETLARSTLVKNEPITEGKVLRPGTSSMLSALLTPGMRAVTLDVSMRQAAAGFILPGDLIDIYHTGGVGDRRSMESSLLYSSVRVLAIDQNASQEAEGALPGSTVTLELSPGQVEGFLTARETGTLSLALRSAFQPEGGDELIGETQPSDVVVIRYGS